MTGDGETASHHPDSNSALTSMLYEVNGDKDPDQCREEAQVIGRVLELCLRVAVSDET